MYNRHDRPKQRPYVGLRYGYHAGCTPSKLAPCGDADLHRRGSVFSSTRRTLLDLHVFFVKLIKVLGVSIMINGISVYVVVDYHEKIFGTLINDTPDVVFGIWFSRSAVTVEGDQNRDLGSPF